jgi:hypothetical protein
MDGCFAGSASCLPVRSGAAAALAIMDMAVCARAIASIKPPPIQAEIDERHEDPTDTAG